VRDKKRGRAPPRAGGPRELGWHGGGGAFLGLNLGFDGGTHGPPVRVPESLGWGVAFFRTNRKEQGKKKLFWGDWAFPFCFEGGGDPTYRLFFQKCQLRNFFWRLRGCLFVWGGLVGVGFVGKPPGGKRKKFKKFVKHLKFQKKKKLFFCGKTHTKQSFPGVYFGFPWAKFFDLFNGQLRGQLGIFR